ncbi:hypothetical protein DW839_07915 [Enterocloster bolteae]|uniref:Uncharacterized protein n=1 Tax=Enterocloster bolteae TaxID=208479 RepID=A0A414AY74_9FIRM|nr:hypothetical protein DW839_07915 [Enterocloster bolteae]
MLLPGPVFLCLLELCFYPVYDRLEFLINQVHKFILWKPDGFHLILPSGASDIVPYPAPTVHNRIVLDSTDYSLLFLDLPGLPVTLMYTNSACFSNRAVKVFITVAPPPG